MPSQSSVGKNGYAWGGVEVPADSQDCVAKAVYLEETQTVRYYVKRATYGPEAGSMYNPNSPMFNQAAARRVNNMTGRPMYEFRPVSQEAYRLYCRFLRTGNTAMLSNAERTA